MALDGFVISNLVYELNGALAGERISKIAQPESDELLLTFKGKNGQQRLCVSAGASLPLMYLTEKNKMSPMTAPNFCMLLRKHLSGGRVLSVTQPGLERVVFFDIEHFDELGDRKSKRLVVELMGKYSNIIFCDDAGTIIDSIKHISAQVSSVREVLPGRPYFIPQTQQKKDPLNCPEEEFISALEGKAMTLSKAVYMSFTGISPLLAQELCFRAGLDGDSPAASFAREDFSRLYLAFCDLLLPVKTGEYRPCMVKKGDEPAEYSSTDLSMYSDFTRIPYDSVSRLLEDYYSEKETCTRIRQRSSDLRRIVTTALERNRKKYELQEKQLKDTEKREKYRLWGELLHIYGYGLEPGAEKLECEDYHTGKPVMIPLDPDLSAQENAKKYFDRYEKLKRTYEALSGRVVETESDIRYLESVLSSLEIARSEADLAQIRDELAEEGYVKKKSSRKKNSEKSRPWHYRTADGYDIFIGKNNTQNDDLTFRFAEGNDWWFHAKKMPGSHVIVKTKTGEIPDVVFEQAAAAAAYYSRGRGSDKVEVDYLQKKNVKKPRGAKPGFVVYYTNYSMAIRPGISTLKEVDEN